MDLTTHVRNVIEERLKIPCSFRYCQTNISLDIYNIKRKSMKQKLIMMAIIIVIVVGLLAYYQYVPLWVSIVSTGAFLFGVLLGWLAKGWSDKHVR